LAEKSFKKAPFQTSIFLLVIYHILYKYKKNGSIHNIK
jgi:hypothetical protein